MSTQTSTWFQKITQLTFVRILLAFLTGVIAIVVEQVAIQIFPSGQNVLGILVIALVAALVAMLVYVAYVRVFEKRSVTELGFAGAIPELFGGILVGALLFSITIGILWLAGFYHITGMNPWQAIMPALGIAIVSGVSEEILFRGLLFRLVERSLGSWLAILISALFFGLAHIANPNATVVSAIAIALEAGVMLAAAFMLTRRLWLVIGIHFAWNFTQGGIFGVAVSGNDMPGLFQSTLTGSPLLSGGEFGAEASLFAVIVCLLAGLYFLWQAYQKGNFVKPYWQRRSA